MVAPHWRKAVIPSVNIPVANLERRFRILSEPVVETKPAAPLIFVLSAATASDCHKNGKVHRDVRWRNGEARNKTDTRYVYMAISSRIAAGEVAPSDFHFKPALEQEAVIIPWHRPVWVQHPTCAWGARAEAFSFHPFTDESRQYLC